MKKLICLLLALIMVLALVACGEKPAAGGDDAAAGDDAASGGDDAATGGDDAGGDDAAAPAGYTGSADFDWSAYKGVDFEIMWQESDDTQIQIVKEYAMPALQEIADEYGINFTWVGNVDQSYTTLAATGELADVWFGNVTMEMIQSDIMLDLTPYLTVDSYLEDTFTTPSFYYFNGVIWALSTGVDSFYNGVLYYNKALLEANGITDISTYDKFAEALKTLNDAGVGGLTFCQGVWYNRFLWQNSFVSVKPEAYLAMLDGDKDVFTTYAAEAAQSINNMRDFIVAGYTPAAMNVHETADAIAEFAAGDYAFLYTDSWQNANVWDQTQATGVDVGVAWWPSDNADYETGAYIAGWGSPLSGWCAKADTEYPELAVEVIKVINRAEAARHLAAGLGTNHVQEGAPTPNNPLEAARFELRANVGEFLKCYWQNTVDSATSTVFKNELQSAISEDDIDVDALVANLDAGWRDNTFFG